MVALESFFILLGGIGLFLCGLKALSFNAGEILGDKMSKVVQAFTKNRLGAVAVGCFSTALLQSSIATNMIVIALVQKGVLSFLHASAVILGTNVGTTITAQLVSLSTSTNFEVSAIGCLIAFIGFLLSLSKGKKAGQLGGAMLGFGLIFVGLKLMTESVEHFKNYEWFTNLFLVKSPLLLLLNGFLITCVFQSSSVVTSILIVLASLDLLDFSSSAFLILGANVGTCLPVIISSSGLGLESKKSAIFNLAFNLVGAIIFFPLLAVFKDFFQSAFTFGVSSIGRSIANFHTIFNLIVTLIILPILPSFCGFIERVCSRIYCKTGAHESQRGAKGAKIPL